MRPCLLVCCAAVVCGGLLGGQSTARAQDAAVLTKVTDLNKKAVEAYENLDMEEAAKFLRQALELCAAEGLNNHKAKARTHIHLGIVMVGGLKQRDRGIQQFKRALEIDPSIRPTKILVNPEIQSAFDEALKDASSAPAPAVAAAKEPKEEPKPPEPPPAPAAHAAPVETAAAGGDGKPPRTVKGIFHQPITEAKPSSTVTVKAAVEPTIGAEKVILAYRPEGASDFLARDMEKDEQGWFVARIPEPATHGSVVSYYIEARNRAGGALAANGSSTEPHVIGLGGESASAAVAAGGDDPPRGGGSVGEVEESFGPSGHKYWFSLGIGGGYGWAKGTPEVNPTNKVGKKLEFAGGFAPAQLLHIVPEVGFFVAPNLLLSLQGRIQIVTAATEVRDASCPDQKNPATQVGVCEPAKGAIAFLGRATWLLGEAKPFRPWVSASAGGGEIRHLIDIEGLKDCGPNANAVCKDTVLGGVLLLGPGAGFTYELSKTFTFVAGVNALVGIPNPTVNFDLNFGVAAGI
jgi:hypothetical protein